MEEGVPWLGEVEEYLRGPGERAGPTPPHTPAAKFLGLTPIWPRLWR